MGDEYVFDKAMETGDVERMKSVARRYVRTYADNNNGSYLGQVKFALASLATESAFLSWEESSIDVPFVIDITSDTDLTAIKSRMCALKCGVQSLVSSVSLEIDGQKIKNHDSTQENIPLTYKILSSTNKNDEASLFDSLKFSLDSPESLAFIASSGETNGNLFGIQEAIGDTLETNSFNGGLKRRIARTSFNPAAANVAQFTNEALTAARRKDYVVDGGLRKVTYHIMVNIPLKRLFYDLDFNLARGLWAKIDVNIHSGSYSYALTHATKATATHTANLRYGQCPVLLANAAQSWNSTANSTITINANVISANGVANGFGASACTFNAVLYSLRAQDEMKYLSAHPKQKVTFSQLYEHRETVVAGGNFNTRVISSASKIRWLLFVPQLAASANGTTALAPYATPFSSSPVTTAKCAQLGNLQIYVGGRPIWESPQQYTSEMFMNEIRPNSLNNGSGLLDQKMWEEGASYYYIRLDRYDDEASDLAGKSVEVRGTNSNLKAMELICFLGTERSFMINNSTGKVEV